MTKPKIKSKTIRMRAKNASRSRHQKIHSRTHKRSRPIARIASKVHAKMPAKAPVKLKKTQIHARSQKAPDDTAKQKQKEVQQRKKVNVNIPQADDVKLALDRLLSSDHATEYLKKNVSKMAVDVIGMLVTPKTDEFLAEQLGIKINAIRRILNIMQGYGITNYYISKNTKGWLSFAWYINVSKLAPFLEYVDGMEREKSIINDTCNDYFICEGCYKSDKFIFTFDAAFENSFKCNNCGRSLNRMNRDEATVFIGNKTSTMSDKA